MRGLGGWRLSRIVAVALYMSADKMQMRNDWGIMTMGFTRIMLLAMTTILGAHSAVAAVSVTKAGFGKLSDGKAVDVYVLKNADVEVHITNYGARITSLLTKDRDGKVADIVLGYNSVEGYVNEGATKTYFGSIVGRYGNRIHGGKFSIDGHTYQIPLNNGANALHGGPNGFSDKLWTAKEIPNGVEMSVVSPDGDMGFPGTLTLHVRYTLVGDALHINYAATSDKPTVTNITNHSYFNLSGEGSGTILGTEMMINADEYTPVDSGLIPSGGPKPVAGTPFDFTKPTVIGARVNTPNDQLKLGGGYDHNWILRGKNGELKLAAKAYDPKSGRVLTVSTTEPGVQFYGGNSLTGAFKGKSGATYSKNTGFCLETQHYPDSPNQPAFPTTELKPGQTMHSETIFAFSVQK
jgi:aldose 1-epimerase